MKRIDSRLSVVIGAIFALSGCRYMDDDKGLFVDPRDDYLAARVGAPLVVPDDLIGVHIVDSWPIPKIDQRPATKLFPHSAPRPDVLLGHDLDVVKIQRLGTRSWMVVGDPPEQVWPLVKQFLADNGIATAQEDPPRGIIKSAWLVVTDQNYGDVVRTAIRDGHRERARQTTGDQGPDAAARGRDQVLFRVENGIRSGSTEVHVSHHRAVGVDDDLAEPIPEVEAEVVAKLAEYLAHGVARAPVSMVARNISSASKARLVRDAAGYPALHLKVDFDRAWATVAQALRRAEIEIAEADREAAVFQTVFPAGDRRGWLQRVVPGGATGAGSRVTIHVRRVAEGVIVSVEYAGDEAMSPEAAEEVLVTLREFAA